MEHPLASFSIKRDRQSFSALSDACRPVVVFNPLNNNFVFILGERVCRNTKRQRTRSTVISQPPSQTDFSNLVKPFACNNFASAWITELSQFSKKLMAASGRCNQSFAKAKILSLSHVRTESPKKPCFVLSPLPLFDTVIPG